MARRFGPNLGAGTVVIEQDAERLLNAAPLGVVGYVGILEKGSTDKLISCSTKSQLIQLTGGRIGASMCPEAAQDFFDHSGGTGEVHLIRITDGTERKSSLKLYSRQEPRQHVITVQAENGGAWAGSEKALLGKEFGPTDIPSETTFDTGATMLLNEWAGATLKLAEITDKSYEVVSNTTAGVVTLKADATLETDYGAGTEEGWALIRSHNPEKTLAIAIGDGEMDPAGEFSLDIHEGGLLVKRYSDLSMDPAAARYFLNIINDDMSNRLIRVTDENAGGSTGPEKRPANLYLNTAAVTATTITADVMQLRPTVGDWNPTVAQGTVPSTCRFAETLRIKVLSGDTTYDLYSMKLLNPTGGAVGTKLNTAALTLGTAVDPAANFDADLSEFIPPFTVTQGTTVAAENDEAVIEFTPMPINSLRGFVITPDKDGKPQERYRIASNTLTTITIGSGDLSVNGDVGKNFMIEAAQWLGEGYDGVDGVGDAHYTDALDPDGTLFNALKGRNKGLVKLAVPGITSTTVQQALVNLAEVKNWQARCEIPSTLDSASDAVDYVLGTLGRNNYAVVAFPSYGTVSDKDKPGQTKLLTLSGAIMGREAAIANNYEGYHKAAAGVDATLFRVLALPAERLDEEQLNPTGIQVIKFMSGNAVIWGDRTLSTDPAWRWKHQRELMSHYENRLLEGFDYIIFAINDRRAQKQLLTTLKAFFIPEWRKGAIRGNTFEQAASIKVDDEINTDLTRAEGELYAEIGLRLADTIERFIIRVGKQGLFESTS